MFIFLFSITVLFLTFLVFLVLLVQASLFSITGFFTTSFVLTLNMQALFYFLGFLSSEVWEAGRCIETKLWRRISLISFMVFFKPEIGLPEQKRKCVGLQFFVAPFLAPSRVVADNATLAIHVFVRKLFCVYFPLL